MSSIALRNMRTLTRKEAYTPSKVETITAYKLNEKKALMKKIDAGKRDLDVEIELKRGTLVITYTPAAYEIYKQAIYFDSREFVFISCSSKLSITNLHIFIIFSFSCFTSLISHMLMISGRSS
jgi:hypothetical protein